MKYTKPKWEPTVIPVVPNAVVSFFHSLPDSFEIVPDGHVCVKWPEGLTRERLVELAARWADVSRLARSDALRALAAIAPVEKKKRKVHLWEKDYPHYTERSWTSDDISRPGEGWHKIGECEVTE